MQEWILKVVEREIKVFEQTVLTPYCTERNLPIKLESLFLREEEENFPDSINFLLGNKVPKYLLYNSKSFMKFYKSLDQDFKRDIVRDPKEIKTIKRSTFKEPKFLEIIKEKLGNDTDVY